MEVLDFTFGKNDIKIAITIIYDAGRSIEKYSLEYLYLSKGF